MHTRGALIQLCGERERGGLARQRCVSLRVCARARFDVCVCVCVQEIYTYVTYSRHVQRVTHISYLQEIYKRDIYICNI